MPNPEHKFSFHDSRWGKSQLVWPQVGYYENGRIAIKLFTYAEDNTWVEPWATATVNVPEIDLEPGDVLIKNYAENEGMVELLTTAGIIKPTATGYFVSTFVTIGAYTLTQEFLNTLETLEV